VAGVIARGAVREDVLPTLARVARSGAVRDARTVAERHADDALAHLESLDGGGLDTGALRAVVRGAVDRDA
jgi:geranylgeranyl pyrophosphate synthase